MRRYIQYPIMLILVLTGFYFYYRQDQNEQLQRVEKIGEQSSLLLLKTLKNHLSAKIASDGVIPAIKFCNREALALTDSVQNVLGRGILIKRTSSKIRNPSNQPGKDEKEAINWFANREGDTDKPVFYISYSKKNGKVYYHYFKPLFMQGLCLNCHGEPSKMNAEVFARIKELYPEDKAFGYKTGEFRGLVHVSIPDGIIRKD